MKWYFYKNVDDLSEKYQKYLKMKIEKEDWKKIEKNI